MMEPDGREAKRRVRAPSSSQETGNVVEIENGMDDEARGTDGGPDIGIELQACGNYGTRFKPVPLSVNVSRAPTEIVKEFQNNLPRTPSKTVRRHQNDNFNATQSETNLLATSPTPGFEESISNPHRNIRLAPGLENDSDHTRPEICR